MTTKFCAFIVAHWVSWCQFGSLVSGVAAGFAVAVPLGLLVLCIFLGAIGWAYEPLRRAA